MYTEQEKEDLFEAICLQIEQGKALAKLIHGPGKIISNTLWNELILDKEKNTRYARAREARADAIFDEIFGIADEATPEDVNVARLKVDTRKWALSKMQPKKYGDKLDVEHSGAMAIEWKETKTYDTDQKTD